MSGTRRDCRQAPAISAAATSHSAATDLRCRLGEKNQREPKFPSSGLDPTVRTPEEGLGLGKVEYRCQKMDQEIFGLGKSANEVNKETAGQPVKIRLRILTIPATQSIMLRIRNKSKVKSEEPV